MPEMKIGEYNRDAVISYAHRWAYKRNPKFYDFSNIGGDCTNFASQCIYAGCEAMNFTPTYGWYYVDLNNRAPAWTSVKYLHQFLVNNKGIGPFGKEVSIDMVEKGDIVQLIIDKNDFQHTPVITSVGSESNRTFDDIIIAAHSYDCDRRPLSTYDIKAVRFIHIEGIYVQ